MGILGTGFQIASGIVSGSANASMWTGNAIYTALQNARTRKEIKQICKHATDTNFQNRAVFLLPGVSKQQLLLTTTDPDDNDIYDYQSNSSSVALDYIWGDSDEPENTIVSGGRDQDRANALIPFVHKAQTKNIPVIVLHSGNSDLEQMITKHSVDYEFISRKTNYYDIFRGMPTDDIAYLLYETMPDDDASPSAESLLRALIEVLLVTSGKVTPQLLAGFQIRTLRDTIDSLKNKSLLSDDEYDDIMHYYMAGSSESDNVRIFLNRLNRQFDSIYGKAGNHLSNIKRMMNQNGVISIDVGTTGNDLVLSLISNHISLLDSQGKKFVILIDNVPIARHQQLVDVVLGHIYALSGPDIISSLHGGEATGDELFSELTGGVNCTVIYRHSSGTSNQKWSDHLGKYKKIHIRYNVSQNNAFMNTSNSRGVSVDETDEPRIRAETISKLPDGVACIHNKDGTLIADVKGI